MKRILTICALMAVLTGCRCQVAQPGRLSADSTEYIVTIEGREVVFPLAFRSENSRVYYHCGSFTEHDTLFFDREYNFYRCDTCRETEQTTSNYFLSTDSPYPFELTDSLIVYQGMELQMCPLGNFRKISDDEYCYDYTVGNGNWYHVSLRRSSKNRDLWLEVVTSPGDEHFILYNAYTPLECIGSFDYINYRSDDHIPEGLCNYEETSPEDF